ncbi:MAG: hypothetical protein NVSMB18_31930 [Acetobacteraceae bacterium]
MHADVHPADVHPKQATHRQQPAALVDRCQPVPVVAALKQRARAEGWSTLVLPHGEHGAVPRDQLARLDLKRYANRP